MAAGRQAEWRKDLLQVRVLQSQGAVPLEWTETPRRGPAIRFHAVRLEPPRLLSLSFKSIAMRGDWEGTLTTGAGGLSKLSIAERVEIFNPVFRAVFWWTAGLDRFADTFLQELKVRAESQELQPPS